MENHNDSNLNWDFSVCIYMYMYLFVSHLLVGTSSKWFCIFHVGLNYPKRASLKVNAGWISYITWIMLAISVADCPSQFCLGLLATIKVMCYRHIKPWSWKFQGDEWLWKIQTVNIVVQGCVATAMAPNSFIGSFCEGCIMLTHTREFTGRCNCAYQTINTNSVQ